MTDETVELRAKVAELEESLGRALEVAGSLKTVLDGRAAEAEIYRGRAEIREKERDRAHAETDRAEARLAAIQARACDEAGLVRTYNKGLNFVARIRGVARWVLEGDAPACVLDGKPATDSTPPRLCAEHEADANHDWEERARRAEARLAAIYARYADGIGICNAVRRDRHEAMACEVVQTEAAAVLAGIKWVLEGDAPNSPGISDGSGADVRITADEFAAMSEDAPFDRSEGRCAEPVGLNNRPCYLPPGHDGWHMARPPGPPLYPCSPTCTHADADTPGHHERVRALLNKMCLAPDVVDSGEDSATSGHLERVKKRSEAVNGAVDLSAKVNMTAGEVERAIENAAEAMRAACWEAVGELLRRDGWGGTIVTRIKAAIEGAAP